jgi:hypothetical protein
MQNDDGVIDAKEFVDFVSKKVRTRRTSADPLEFAKHKAMRQVGAVQRHARILQKGTARSACCFVHQH